MSKKKFKPIAAKCTKGESMTIPGQSMNLRELVEKSAGGSVVAQGLVKQGVYTGDVQANDANSIDITHRIEKARIYQKEIDLLEKNKKTAAIAEEKKKLRDELLAEIEAEKKNQQPDPEG